MIFHFNLINSQSSVPGWSFKNGHFLSGLISEDRTAYKDLTEAMKSCKKYGSCKGVTHDVRRKVYELRAGKQFIKSSTGERSRGKFPLINIAVSARFK